MRIRNFREEDIGSIVSIWNDATKEDRDFSPLFVKTWKEWLTGPQVVMERDVFVAEEEKIWIREPLHAFWGFEERQNIHCWSFCASSLSGTRGRQITHGNPYSRGKNERGKRDSHVDPRGEACP